MPRLGPVPWQELIRRLRRFGFEGPFSGGRHPYMVRGDIVITIPNPHRKEISVDLLTRLLWQAGISRDEWSALA